MSEKLLYSKHNKALMTDLYQLTMAAGYFENNMNHQASFELFVRKMPEQRGYMIFAGLDQVAQYLADLHFEPEEIEYELTVQINERTIGEKTLSSPIIPIIIVVVIIAVIVVFIKNR